MELRREKWSYQNSDSYDKRHKAMKEEWGRIESLEDKTFALMTELKFKMADIETD